VGHAPEVDDVGEVGASDVGSEEIVERPEISGGVRVDGVVGEIPCDLRPEPRCIEDRGVMNEKIQAEEVDAPRGRAIGTRCCATG